MLLQLHSPRISLPYSIPNTPLLPHNATFFLVFTHPKSLILTPPLFQLYVVLIRDKYPTTLPSVQYISLFLYNFTLQLAIIADKPYINTLFAPNILPIKDTTYVPSDQLKSPSPPYPRNFLSLFPTVSPSLSISHISSSVIPFETSHNSIYYTTSEPKLVPFLKRIFHLSVPALHPL